MHPPFVGENSNKRPLIFTNWLGSAPGVAPNLLGPSHFSGDYGYAASIWQQVTAPDPNRPKTGLTLFASNTWADPRTSYQNLQAFAGAYYLGLWSKRPFESWGMALGYNHVAGNVQKAERQYIAAYPNTDYGVQSNEFVGEVFYSFDVYHGLNIEPVLQYIIDPGGYTHATNQVVFGMQLSVPL
jgi:porin